MVKVKNTPAPAAAPQLAEPAPEHTYGWNVMSNCTSADVVLEHKSKLDSFELFVARTPEGVWVGGGRATYKTGGYGCDASLKNAGFPTFAEAAQWAAGRLLLLDKTEKLTPNARRKLEALAALLPEPAPTEQEAELPWLDCDGAVLLEGDKATVLPDVSKRLSGKLVQVLGDYDAQKKSVQVEPVGWEGEPFGILLCYLKRLPVLGENLEEPAQWTSGITSGGSLRPELAAQFKQAALTSVLVATQAPATDVARAKGRRQEPVAPLVQAGTAAHEAAQPTTPAPKLSTFDALQDGVASYKAGLRVLPLASITVTRNTRKVFDEAALAELASSIQAHGVLQPIVVRPAAEAAHYELVAGERRYRAALAAGLAEIPATVRVLTDREFLEVQLLENLQRVDVRPADEAQAFAELLKNGFSAEEVALKVGKPTKFVLQRAKLVALLPFWMDALLDEKLDLAAAHELARLPAHSQLAVKHETEKQPYNFQKRYGKRDIRDIIEQEVVHNLGKVGWDVADATLLPSAGPCTLCPKRSGAQGLLFETKNDKDLCLDAGCFAQKKAAHLARRVVAVAAEVGTQPLRITPNWTPDKAGKEAGVVGSSEYNYSEAGKPGAMPAVVVDGPEAGQLRYVSARASGSGMLASPEEAAAAKAKEDARIRQQRLDKTLRVITAEKLTFDLQLLPTGYAAVATLRYLIEDDLRGQSSSKLAYLVSGFGWPAMTEGQGDHWKQREENGEYPYTNYLRANMESLDFEQLLRLFLTLQVRHKMDYEWENRQEKIAQLVGFRYDGLQQQAEQAVEARYYTKKGKKQEASA